jgi:hypothetical protein
VTRELRVTVTMVVVVLSSIIGINAWFLSNQLDDIQRVVNSIVYQETLTASKCLNRNPELP